MFLVEVGADSVDIKYDVEIAAQWSRRVQPYEVWNVTNDGIVQRDSRSAKRVEVDSGTWLASEVWISTNVSFKSISCKASSAK